ncbi:MAG: hypothetical protein EHM23_00885 [Acidobacteria bacterium]|nr:MAG: hypothetical protein EHM23_00885 [Acidobacteriota bacterium]
MLTAMKMFYVGAKLFAVLALTDFEPGDAYVCRMSPTSPAGFDYIYVDQVKAGDVQVRYEDECDAAIQMIADQDI